MQDSGRCSGWGWYRWVEPLFELGTLHFSGGSTPLSMAVSLSHSAPPLPEPPLCSGTILENQCQSRACKPDRGGCEIVGVVHRDEVDIRVPMHPLPLPNSGCVGFFATTTAMGKYKRRC